MLRRSLGRTLIEMKMLREEDLVRALEQHCSEMPGSSRSLCDYESRITSSTSPTGVAQRTSGAWCRSRSR